MPATKDLKDWVNEVEKHTLPNDVLWLRGTKKEYNNLVSQMMKDGTLLKLNGEYENCYLHRSHQNDVARSEARTFICTELKEQVGPLNNWMHVQKAKTIYDSVFRGCMASRTMYVIPYLIGPPRSDYSQVGVEVTDSPYVALNMMIITRIGDVALEHLRDAGFVKGIHSKGSLDPENRYIMHIPGEKLILSINSNYGGNALLGKKCHALRIASTIAKKEGWLAEHMLLLEIEDPHGKKYYIAAAFPSASGKTNLAMINPPENYGEWKTRLIGDDIAWLHLESDGRLYAINPENGFFGVAPGTSEKTNPNAMATIKKNTIFTNAAIDKDGKPWWEGLEINGNVIDWTGNECDPKEKKAAHPNSRFTSPISQYPSLSSHWEDPVGVPLSAIIFGGRRESLIPLVSQSFDWNHGVFMGATMGVEQTAAAEGKVGEVRRDPMAMRPFCGYNIYDYFSHWLSFSGKSENLPKIFYVNWFRKKDGKFLWPGYGENFRILEWIIGRCEGKAKARKTAIGFVPFSDSINSDGLELEDGTLETLLDVDRDGWLEELRKINDFFLELGKVPEELKRQFESIRKNLG